MSQRLRVVIGITAHNEGRNIGRLLERLRSFELSDVELLRIVVVASGCTDDTVDVARRAAASDARIHLIVDPQRRGKAAAINQLLSAVRDADIIVMESADTLPEGGAIPALLARFADPAVGMVGAHPIPEDDESTFIGFANQLLWRLHHEIASVSPKQGELVAWRNIVQRIPEDVAVDEAYLEAAITRAGLRLAYAAEARVRNRGPATVRSFIVQRRRIHAGHRLLAARERYRPATRDHLRLLRLALADLARRPFRAHWFVAAAALEVWTALLGWWDYAVSGRPLAVWPTVEGTKTLARAEREAPASVAVVIVTYEGAGDALACLASVERNGYTGLRVVVVDNASTDGTSSAVRAAHPGAEVIALEENRGLAHGFNVGMRRALELGADYVVLLNQDMVVAPDLVDRLVRAADAEPRAGAVGGPIYRFDDPERLWYAGGEILWWLGKTYHRGREMLDGPRFQRPRRVGYAVGGAVLYRADALRQVGGWDEEYFLVFEDSDWCVRAARRGWRNLYVPGAKSWHRISTSFGGEKAPLYLYFLFRNNIRFMRKHARPWHWPTFLLFFAAESLLRYSLTSLRGPQTGARERAIWLAVLDALRGRYGRGSFDAFLVRHGVPRPDYGVGE